MIGRVGSFISKNRQQLINMCVRRGCLETLPVVHPCFPPPPRIGVYFVFSYSIHNYRVKIAWDEREVEFNKVKAELSQVKDGLTSDEAWLAGAAAKVKAARANAQGSVLRDEIVAKIALSSSSSSSSISSSSSSVAAGGKAAAAAAGDKDTHMIASLVNGLGGGKIL